MESNQSQEEKKPESTEQSSLSSTLGATSRTSTLSADAPPFEFSSNQLSSTKLSVAAKEFVPRSFVPPATPAYVEPFQYAEVLPICTLNLHTITQHLALGGCRVPW